MDLHLDMTTIFITIVVGHIFSVFLISAYWSQHKKDTTFNIFFLAKCLQAIAWLFITLKGGIPDIFTISFANTLLFLGNSLEAIAILKLLNAYSPYIHKINIIFTSFGIIGFYLLLLFYNLESMRVAFASFHTAIVVGFPAYLMLKAGSRSSLKKFMGYFYLFVMLSLFGRGVGALMNRPMGFFTSGIIQNVSFLALYLVMFLGNIGFILLLKERTDDELVRLASTDELTNILNRRTFILRAKECLKNGVKEKKPISFLLFDVDQFKIINDTYGHITGDRVLRDLAERINCQIGSQHLFGRYGGDEFSILLYDMGEKESTRLTEQIMQQVSEAVIQDLPISYSISIGIVTVIPDQHSQLEALYITCDKALYKAKNNGRNCVSRGFLNKIPVLG